MSESESTSDRTQRGAIWCDRDIAALVTQVAHLRGMSVREYMRDLSAVAKQHRRAAVDALHAETHSS